MLTVERSVPIMVAMKSWVIGKRPGTHAVLSHQQPPRETLLYIVKAIARRGLRDLHSLKTRVPVQDHLQLRCRRAECVRARSP